MLQLIVKPGEFRGDSRGPSDLAKPQLKDNSEAVHNVKEPV